MSVSDEGGSDEEVMKGREREDCVDDVRLRNMMSLRGKEEEEARSYSDSSHY